LHYLRPQRLNRRFPMLLSSGNPPNCSTIVFVIILIRILHARSSSLLQIVELLFSLVFRATIVVFMLLRLLALSFISQILDIMIGVISNVLLDKGVVAVGVLKELHLEVVDLTL
jgi:hypothetical protein